MAMDPHKDAALRKDIHEALMNRKVLAFPMAIRQAWHASGTYQASDNTGGSDGATTRFEPEASDPANAGLSIARDMMHQVKLKHPDVSIADIWTKAGALAVEFAGGPKIVHTFGRTDAANGAKCPANGRLPDAAQGAAHLRQVFHRMGFNDKDIVALSGAHTLGRCHVTRSGFDGKWTYQPLRFDNEYFRNLMFLEWKKRDWAGNEQYEDVATGELMMLPTDMAIKTDPIFREHALVYAKDQAAFFRDFADAYARLLALGTSQCPAMRAQMMQANARDTASAVFREACMHGDASVSALAAMANVHEGEPGTGRTALHKAAYWGHDHIVKYLCEEHRVDVNLRDVDGDSAVHDAARFGQVACVKVMLQHGADLAAKNKAGHTALDLSRAYNKPEVQAALLATPASAKL